jgi:hypothetical protein
MSRRPASPTSSTRTEETTSLGFARTPFDACEETAKRLNVIIEMLNNHDCSVGIGPQRPDDDPTDDNGGYDIAIMREALRDIRDMLRLSARTAAQKQEHE